MRDVWIIRENFIQIDIVQFCKFENTGARNNMEITVSQEVGRVPVTVFEVSGFINLGSASQLEQKAQEEYQAGMRYLLLDLGEVESMSSAGLRSILTISKMLASENTDQLGEESASENVARESEKTNSTYIKLLNPQPGIRRVLRIAGFDNFVEIYEDKEQAVRSF